jgi:GT2 family glycosyltransferase
MPALQGFLESLTRHAATGWARDPANPARRVTIRALAEGRILAEAPADMFRGDVQAAGLGDGNCGFVLDLAPHAATLAGTGITLADAETGLVLPGSPAPAADPPSVARFLSRWDEVPRPTLLRLRRMMRHRIARQGVSVIARTRRGLPALLQSLHAQLAGAWELLVRENTLPPGGNIRLLGPRTRPRFPLTLVVTGAAELERDALWHLLRAAQNPAPAAFLWDHARLLPGAADIACRPAFSPDAFRANPDPGVAFAVRTALAPATDDPAGLLLALAETHPIAHIPRILHRTPDPPRAPGAMELRAVRRHLARIAPEATAELTQAGLVTHWPQPQGRTLAIIPTRNQAGLLRTCLESLFRTREATPLDIVVIDHDSDEPEARAYLRQIAGLVTVMPYQGPFDFARMNNQAVARHGAEAETLLFLNNDTEALAPGWLTRLRSLAARPDVGAVGALLLYPDRRIQHAGVVLGFDGSATHAHAMRHAFAADGTRLHGPNRDFTALREVTAVTAACMMMRTQLFRGAGGFDEALPIGFNDTDLCLRLRARGTRILQDGQTVLLHHESRTRKPAGQWLHAADTARFQSRWAHEIRRGDPFYNPNLRLDSLVGELRPDCLPGGPPRISSLAAPTPPGAAPAAAATPASAAPRRRRSSG